MLKSNVRSLLRNPRRFLRRRGGFNHDSYSQDWLFLREESRELYAIIDGERVRFGIGERESDIPTGFAAGLATLGTGRVMVHERLMYKLSREDFSKLANSKSVELKVGNYEFKLKDEHQQAFRDLMSLAAPEEKK